MRTTAELRKLWSPACKGRTTTLLLHSGARITVNEATTEAFRALDTVMQAANYAPRAPDTGGYNCRKITGGTGYSLHAFGIAVDYNWNSNPYRADGKLITDMPNTMVAAIKSIRTTKGATVFRWGGDYSKAKDSMHFEVVASPRELTAGIAWPGMGLPDPDPQRPASFPVLERGTNGPTVSQLQKRLSSAGFDIANDGVFGAKTEQAVKGYQTSRGLKADGVVGAQTWTALLTDQGPVDPKDSPIKLATDDTKSKRLPSTCKRGSKGKSVGQLQELLAAAGFDCGAADGVFGAKTEEAVKAFQRARALEADGIAGKATWQALIG